jgi:hypothetical protein
MGDAALPGRAIDERDAENRFAIVADVVTKAGVIATILEDITGLNLARVANYFRHGVVLFGEFGLGPRCQGHPALPLSNPV